MTPEEAKKAFMDDLQSLLNEHGAEIEITNSGEPYGQHRGIAEVMITNKELTGYCGFELPQYLDPINDNT